MNCPKCNSENVVLVAGVMHCNGCDTYFDPPMIEAEKVPIVLESTPAAPTSSPATAKSFTRELAENLAFISFLFMGLGLVVMVIGALACEGKFIIPILVGGGIIGTGFWLFLVAQIIHIRANTEK
jgi:hypothetical protein